MLIILVLKIFHAFNFRGARVPKKIINFNLEHFPIYGSTFCGNKVLANEYETFTYLTHASSFSLYVCMYKCVCVCV